MNEYDNGWDVKAPHFCPEYKSSDFIKGNYYTEKYSWLRLAVHRCDPTELIEINNVVQNKTCASREEQDLFFRETILAMTINDKQPAL